MPSFNASPLAAHRPGEILVQFEGAAPAAFKSQALEAVSGRMSEILRPGNGEGELARISLGEGVSAEKAMALLSKLPGVKFVEPDYAVSVAAVSDDTHVAAGRTWGLYGDQGSPSNAYGSQATEAWAAGQMGSTKVAIGVLDSGIDYTHPDLHLNVWLNQNELPAAFRSALKDVDADGLITFRDLNDSRNGGYVADKNGNGRIDAGDLLNDSRWENGVDDDGNGYRDDLVGWDFVNNDNDPMDDHGHGTHVAGTIGAVGGNGAGVAGVAWSVQMVGLKFLDSAGTGFTSNAIKALDYYTGLSKAGSDADFAATNNSWGGGGFSQALLDSITRGAKQDILHIAAAGNGGSDKVGDNNDLTPNYPSNYSTLASAGYEAVIAVAALTNAGGLASYSNYGAASVDLGAPGSSIYSTLKGGGYGGMSGTSMATPHVAGAVALYAAAAPAASAAKIRADLLGSTKFTASLDGKTVTEGRLDVAAFVAKTGAAAPGGLVLTGSSSADTLTAGAAHDTLDGLAGNDVLQGGEGDDRLLGGDGADKLYGDVGRDTLVGGDGVDHMYGGAGADRMEGGAGSDRYYVDSGQDLVIEAIAGSAGGLGDQVTSTVSYTLGANVERLTLSGSATTAVGNGLDNTIRGTGGANSLSGLAGEDTLKGNGGADTLRGGEGADLLIGGSGEDRFVFGRGEAAGDAVKDFAAGDLIELVGYSVGSTLSPVAGSVTDWVIRDGVSGATEVLVLSNGYALTSGDFLFT